MGYDTGQQVEVHVGQQLRSFDLGILVLGSGSKNGGDLIKIKKGKGEKRKKGRRKGRKKGEKRRKKEERKGRKKEKKKEKKGGGGKEKREEGRKKEREGEGEGRVPRERE